MPLAVSKIVSEKLERRQYKNAYKIFKGALFYGAVLGVSFGLFAFLGADWLATLVYKSQPAAVALKVLAPTLTVACILGVMRGFFQGMGNMIPTAISQIFEQIVNAVVSVIAAYELTVYGVSISKMSKLGESAGPAYGAAGGTLGTLTGAIAALIIVVIVFWNSYGNIKKPIRKGKTKVEDSYSNNNKSYYIYNYTCINKQYNL